MLVRFAFLLGSIALLGCTPRPSASLTDPGSTTPKVRSPETSGVSEAETTAKNRWVDLSVESEFGCAVERTGSVYCWGRGPSAEMKLRELPDQPKADPMAYGARKWGPISRIELIHDARKVSTSPSLACAIVEDGRVRCWGSVRWGTMHVYDVPGLTGAVDIEIGDGESCAALETGELRCWSADDYGVPRTRLDGAIAMSVSDNLACGLTKAGDVVCWGTGVEDWHRYDTQFQQQQPPSPTAWQELEDRDFPDTLEVGRFRGAVDLAISGWNNLCILRADGKLVCSQRDLYSVLRNEDLDMREFDGASGVTDFSTTRTHGCARTLDERALCWGRNVYGQLGDGGSTTREQAAAVAELTGVVDISVAEDFSCALTRTDEIACWGFDRGEGLGREEIHVHTVEGVRASSIAAAGRTTCAVDETKKLRCWGSEMLEQTGIAAAAQPTILELPAKGEIVEFTSGWESCFLLSDKTLQCGEWSTQFGASAATFNPTTSTTDVSALAPFAPPACTITGAGRQAKLNCGQSFSQLEPESRLKAPFDVSTHNMRACVAHGGGKVSCFAEYYYWGDRPKLAREFKAIAGIDDAVALTSGLYHDCALLKSGRVSCWVGRTESEWSEDGRTATAMHYRASDPEDMGLEQIVALVSGSQHHCALSKTGAVRCWSDSPYAEQTEWREVPELPADIVELAAGVEHTCARTKTGAVTCWGDDVWGQLGRVPSRVYLSPTIMKVD